MDPHLTPFSRFGWPPSLLKCEVLRCAKIHMKNHIPFLHFSIICCLIFISYMWRKSSHNSSFPPPPITAFSHYRLTPPPFSERKIVFVQSLMRVPCYQYNSNRVFASLHRERRTCFVVTYNRRGGGYTQLAENKSNWPRSLFVFTPGWFPTRWFSPGVYSQRE